MKKFLLKVVGGTILMGVGVALKEMYEDYQTDMFALEVYEEASKQGLIPKVGKLHKDMANQQDPETSEEK